MTTAAILFISTFAVVFALGLQSLNVNRGHYLAAAITSFAISGANLFVLKIVPTDINAIELAAYFAGGPLGIVCAMWAHPRLARWLARGRVDSTPPKHGPTAPPDDPAIGRLTEIHRHKGGTIEARVELNERGIAWATAALRNKPKRRPAPTMRTF